MQADLDRDLVYCRQFLARYGHDPGRLKARPAGDSGYNRLTGAVLVAGDKTDEIDRYETVAHEVGHRLTDRAAGWGGLLYVGASGTLAEGLSETISAAAVAERFGEEVGLSRLNPNHKTLPMTFFGEVPIPTHKSQISWKYLDDLGGVHLNCGIVRQAHLNLAQNLGMSAMAGLVLQTVPELKPWSTPTSFARASRDCALRQGDAHGAQAIEEAWNSVGIRI
ncbi:MAG: hypothetical protein KF760_24420 [Candidatus Eremiobacteraeota bacterium]|nr:hypothetical protein [Candidatus Eremiobacteraeota bacterium]MCW5867525.1 hypothetical protein [Candidatus Eremiobacteraeota bacterium]